MIRFTTKQKTKPAVHLTALIDMVFLLLVFFLLASNFIDQQGVAIIVPEIESAGANVVHQVVVNIDSDGNIVIDGVSMDHEHLKNVLRVQLNKSLNDSIIIRADRRAEYNIVVEAIDAAKLAGASNIILVTKKTSGDVQ